MWIVKYTASAPTKKLTTRFRLNNQFGPSGEISLEIVNKEIEISIDSTDISLEIIDDGLFIQAENPNISTEIGGGTSEIEI